MSPENTSSAAYAQKPFMLSRVFAAPRDLVFRVWTERDHLLQWWGPKDFEILSVTNDFRPGGMMHYGLRAPDGMELYGRWIYREITPPERLVFEVSFSDPEGGVAVHPWSQDWPLTTLSTITFAEAEGGTRVTVEWIPINATDPQIATFDAGRPSMEQGWGGTMDRLGAYLQKAAQS